MLQNTILTLLRDLDVKVMEFKDFFSFGLDVLVEVFLKTHIPFAHDWIFYTCTVVRYWSKVWTKVVQGVTLALLSDLNAKLMGLENRGFTVRMFWLKFL